MYQVERHSQIINMLKEKEVLSNQEIMNAFHISRDTARRDIVALVEAGLATRTHGGIALPKFTHTVYEYKNRAKVNIAEKQRIAEKAATYLNEGQIYMIDVSTTIELMCDYLDFQAEVYTHSLDVIEVLSQKPKVNTYALGGKLNTKNRYFSGVETVTQLMEVRTDIAFLGAEAITEDGIFYENKEDAYVKKAAVLGATKVIVLADYEKFHSKSNYFGVGFDDVDIMITDRQLDDNWTHLLKEHHVEIVIAQEES